MGSLFRERFWIVQLSGLAIVAALAGSTAMTLVSASLFDVDAVARPADEDEPEEDEDEAPEPAPPVQVLTPKKPIDAILARNVFCPTCVPGTETPAPTAVLADAPLPAGTSLPLKLVATMESSDPSASLATFYNTSTHTTGVFSPGDVVLPGAELVNVRGGIVGVRYGSAMLQLRVGEPPKVEAVKSEPTAKPATAKKPAAKTSIPGAEEAIKCTDENSCDVEREFVESLLSNPASLASQAAVRPTANGFAFTRVRAGTLPYLLGLRTGDVITEVNGEALDSLDKAIGLATKLRHATNLSVSVQRKGKTLQKEIRIS